MNQFVIHLPVENYISTDFGELYVQLGDYYFPDKVWTDFGETVVFGWKSQLTKLFSKQSGKIRCKFMDGNFRFDVETTNSKELLNLLFIREKRDSDETEHQEMVYTEQFFQEILRVNTAIQEECKKNGNYEAVNRIEIKNKEFQSAKDSFMKANQYR